MRGTQDIRTPQLLVSSPFYFTFILMRWNIALENITVWCLIICHYNYYKQSDQVKVTQSQSNCDRRDIAANKSRLSDWIKWTLVELSIVSVRYTYGKGVKGTVRLEVCYRGWYSYWRYSSDDNDNERPCAVILDKVGRHVHIVSWNLYILILFSEQVFPEILFSDRTKFHKS